MARWKNSSVHHSRRKTANAVNRCCSLCPYCCLPCGDDTRYRYADNLLDVPGRSWGKFMPQFLYFVIYTQLAVAEISSLSETPEKENAVTSAARHNLYFEISTQLPS